MMEEDKAKFQSLKEERDRKIAQNRELEFELIMLEEVSKDEQARDQQKCEDVEHKIETLKLK